MSVFQKIFGIVADFFRNLWSFVLEVLGRWPELITFFGNPWVYLSLAGFFTAMSFYLPHIWMWFLIIHGAATIFLPCATTVKIIAAVEIAWGLLSKPLLAMSVYLRAEKRLRKLEMEYEMARKSKDVLKAIKLYRKILSLTIIRDYYALIARLSKD